MRKILFSALFLPFSAAYRCGATHLIGGELTYQCLGGNNYGVTLKIYRDCKNGIAPFDDPGYVFVFNSSGALVQTLTLYLGTVTNIPVVINDPCLIAPPDVCVEEGLYNDTVNLPPLPGGYWLVYQRCCRNHMIKNISDPGGTGSTYAIQIPGSGPFSCNSSPVYNNFPPVGLCAGKPIVFDHSATDPDGDSLVYELCTPLAGADTICPMPKPNPYPGCPAAAPPPPYAGVNFISPYSEWNPIPANPPLSIDPVTGLLTGTPDDTGNFVVGVCVSEYRNGQLLSVNLRDFQFNIVACGTVASTPTFVLECDDYTVNFQNSSFMANGYFWSFGDGGTSTDAKPSHTYADTGIYYATLIASPGQWCADTATVEVRIYPGLDPAFGSVSACAGSPVQFTDYSFSSNGPLTAWLWYFGDGGTSTAQNPSHIYATGGNYTVLFTVTDIKGCVKNASQTLSVFYLPKTDFTYGPLCYGTPVLFADSSSVAQGVIVNWQWNFNGEAQSGPDSVLNTFADTGWVSVTLVTVSDKNCTDTAVKSLYIRPLPAAVAGDDTVICPGSSVTLGAVPVPGYTYAWSPDSALSASVVSNPLLTLYNPSTSQQTHLYVLTVTENGCRNTDTVAVSVFPEIRASIPLQQEQCLVNNQFNFTALGTFGAGAAFSWDFGDGWSATAQDPSHVYTDTGHFIVSLTIYDNGCMSSATAEAVVARTPVAYFAHAGSIGCDPFTAQFFARSLDPGIADSELTYSWDFGDPSSGADNFSTLQNPSHLYSPAGQYVVTLRIEYGVCADLPEMTAVALFFVNPSPAAALSVTPAVTDVEHTEITVTGSPFGETTCFSLIDWQDSIAQCSFAHNFFEPFNPYGSAVYHTVAQIVSNEYGCTDTAAEQVRIDPVFHFFVPDAFTPNGDGLNDFFAAKATGIRSFEMFIFDRWGDEIFHSPDLFTGWDGSVNGHRRTAQQDVYVYLIKLTDFREMPHRYVGRVTLVR